METKIIDGHMHILQWVEQGEKSVFDVIEEYRKANSIAYVDNMCCTSNGDLWDGYEMDQSILGAVAKLENPHVFSHGCLYIPKDPALRKKYPFKDQLEELMELGMDGVKICDFKPDAYKLLDVEAHLSEYEEYIGLCEKYGVHMCWHVADPDFFWDETKVSDRIKELGWFYGDGTYPSYDFLMDFARQMIEKHPKLHVMLAHAFFKSNQPEEVEALLAAHPNVTIDLALGREMFDGFRTHYAAWHRLFRKYSDRFVYATDAATAQPAEKMSARAQSVLRFLSTDDRFTFADTYQVHGIRLEQGHLENILHKNHENAVGCTPRPIHRPALKKYIERYLPLMPDSRNRQMTESYYRKQLL